MVDGPRERREEVTEPRERRAAPDVDSQHPGDSGVVFGLVSAVREASLIGLAVLLLVLYVGMMLMPVVVVGYILVRDLFTFAGGGWPIRHVVWLVVVLPLALLDHVIRSASGFRSDPPVLLRFLSYTPLAVMVSPPLIAHVGYTTPTGPVGVVLSPAAWSLLAAAAAEKLSRPPDEQEPPGMDLRLIGPDESQFDGTPSKEQTWDEWFESELDGDRRRWRR